MSDSAKLLAMLRRGPATWTDLRRAGLDRTAVLLAIGEIVDRGDDRIRVGPVLVELEGVEDFPP